MATLLPFQRQVRNAVGDCEHSVLMQKSAACINVFCAVAAFKAVFYPLQMVEELIREDGMCLMSAGMGWQRAVAVILRLQMERRR